MCIRDRSKYTDGAYIFKSTDHFKTNFFIELLNRHQIDVYANEQNQNFDRRTYLPGESYIVPKQQKQAGLVKTLFETVHTFNDSIFYDVSAWTLPLAFNLDYSETTQELALGKKITEALPFNLSKERYSKKPIAYAIDWQQYNASRLLYALQAKNIKSQVVLKEATISNEQDKSEQLELGTVIITLGNQEQSKEETMETVSYTHLTLPTKRIV